MALGPMFGVDRGWRERMGAGEIAPDPRAGVHGSKSLCCNATTIRDILCSEHPERCRIIALLSYHELFGNAAMPPPPKR